MPALTRKDVTDIEGFHGGCIEVADTPDRPLGDAAWVDAFVDGWLVSVPSYLTPASDTAMKMADDTPEAKTYEAREKAARDTIDNLVTGKLSTSTIKDVKDAANKALNDRNAGNAIGRAIR